MKSEHANFELKITLIYFKFHDEVSNYFLQHIENRITLKTRQF